MEAVNVLSRPAAGPVGPSKQELTRTQRLVDHAVEHFVEAASDSRFLAAATGGGLAFRMGRWVTAESLASFLHKFPTLLRGLSSLAGVSAESAVFSESTRFFNISPLSSFGNNLTATFLSLSSLRLLGRLSVDQNILVQHLFADLGMVTGHHLSSRLGLGPAPEGTLSDQLLEAETFNWQMKAGMALTAEFLPEPQLFGRGLELSSSRPAFDSAPLPFLRLRAEGAGKKAPLEILGGKNSELILMVGSNGGRRPGDPLDPYRTVDPEIQRIKELFDRAAAIRLSLLSSTSEERKERYLAEYLSLAKNFPASGPEVYSEAAQWRTALLEASHENVDLLFQGYKSVVASFKEGGFLTYREGKALCERFTQSNTQQERWRVLKGLEILAERFDEGHPEVYETARFVRDLFQHPSSHTRRQAFGTYRALVPYFSKGNVEISLALREIRNLYYSLDPKTQVEAQETLEAVEQKLTFWEQLSLFMSRMKSLSFLKQDPKI